MPYIDRVQVEENQNFLLKPESFDSIIKQVSINLIPIEFIDQVYINYVDGETSIIDGADIHTDVDDSEGLGKLASANQIKPVRELRMSVNVKALEMSVNRQVEQLIGKFC